MASNAALAGFGAGLTQLANLGIQFAPGILEKMEDERSTKG